VTDHPRDLLADFLVYYRARPETFSGPEMLALAYRLPAYGGMMAARVTQQEARDRRNTKPGARMVEETHAEVSSVIEFG
jgi:hypothetical protein